VSAGTVSGAAASRPAPGRPARRSSPSANTARLLRRYVVVGLRQPVFGFVFPIVFPVVLVVFVRAMFERVAALPGFPLASYTAYIAPGLIMLIPMLGAGFGAVTLIDEIRSGFTDRLRLYGVSTPQIMVAKYGFEMVRILPAAVIVIALLALLDAPLRAGVLTGALLTILLFLWSAAYSSLFYLVGLRTLNPQAPVAMLPLALPVLFFSQALMPSTFLSEWLRISINLNPFSHVVSAAATIMYGEFDVMVVLQGCLVAIGMFAVLQIPIQLVIRRRIGR
jgi:ABC-2 type transport system permease protein